MGIMICGCSCEWCAQQHIGTHLPPMPCHLVTRLGCIIGLLSAAALPVAGYPAFLVLQSSISPTDARGSCWRNRSRRNSIAAWVTMRAHMYSTASLTTPGPRGIIDSSDVLLHQTPYASLCSYHPLLHSPHFRLVFRDLRITCYLRWPICKKHTVQQFPTS